MTEQANNSNSQDTHVLRLLIVDAVQRELTNVLAPLRNQVQILDGIVKQFNRDLGGIQAQVADLDEVVRGNPRQNVVGLSEQIAAQGKTIEKTQQKVTEDIAALRREVMQSIERVSRDLTTTLRDTHGQLAATLHEVQEDQKRARAEQATAREKREALLNQARGAKLALLALSVISGFPLLERLAALLKLFP